MYQDPHIKNKKFILHYGDLTDTSNITRIMQEVKPDEIYNLGAQSHVQVSFEVPEYTARYRRHGNFEAPWRPSASSVWKSKYNLNFELFLLPNNQCIGALEDFREKIIIDNNQSIFDCWNGFENCLQNNASKIIGRNLTVPAKKTKIYAYLEVLLGITKKEKEKIIERERDYKNIEHWNLDSDFLVPLKDFLLKYL